MSTGHVVWSRPIAAGTESSPIVRPDGVLRRPGRHAAGAERVQRRTSTGPTTPAARSRAARAGRTASSTSATTRAAPTRSTRRPGTRSGPSGTSGAHFGFGSGQLLLDAGGRLRPRLHGQHRRPRVLVRRRGPERWRGPPAPAPTSTPRPRWRTRPALGPTVYIGSYDGNLYAFNAQSGAVRWRHAAGGKISGSATVVDETSSTTRTLGTARPPGSNVRTGRRCSRSRTARSPR